MAAVVIRLSFMSLMAEDTGLRRSAKCVGDGGRSGSSDGSMYGASSGSASAASRALWG